jgi:threonine synthase
MREMGLYGAEVVKVTGTYDQAKEVAGNYASRHRFHAERGAKGVVGKESMKTMAYEIAERLGWRAPDWYVQAVSGGIGPIGVWKGFSELYEMGLIDSLPKLAIIQSEGCNPMVRAFRAGKSVAEPVTPRTNITVLSTGDPGMGYTYLYEATTSQGGTMTSVSDEAAFTALRRLARTEGISVEPATAVAFAGLEQLAAEGILGPDETVVVNASGHTLPVEKFILSDQHFVDIAVNSPLADTWGMPEEGLIAALDALDEKVTSVVIIDDSPQDSRLIRRLLQRHKEYRIFEANDSQEGLALIRERQPDLITIDLMMPDMDGFTLLEALKEDPTTADIPVIVVSGKTLTAAERKQLEEQAVSMWVKGDYSTRDLVDHIVTQLDDIPDGEEQTVSTHEKPPQDDYNENTILIIEDNPVDGRLLRRILDQRGPYAIHEARTGEQALAHLEEHTPHLIIMDLMLPDISGFDLLERIRARAETAQTPVMVLTAKELTHAERSLLEKSATGTYIKGQFPRTDLEAQVSEVFNQK